MPQRVSWSAELVGDAAVLANWSQNLTQGFDPTVTLDPVQHAWNLNSADFDVTCNSEDIRLRAVNVLIALNGAMAMLGAYSGIRLGDVIERFDDGSSSSYASLSSAAHIQSFLSAVIVSTGAPQAPKPSDPQRWLVAAETDEIIEDLLAALGRSDSWFDLYKVYECLKKLQSRPGMQMFSSWWPDPSTTTIEESFKETANFNRHSKGYRRYRLPSIVMSHDDAKMYIRNWSVRALQQIVP